LAAVTAFIPRLEYPATFGIIVYKAERAVPAFVAQRFNARAACGTTRRMSFEQHCVVRRKRAVGVHRMSDF